VGRREQLVPATAAGTYQDAKEHQEAVGAAHDDGVV
jgi:hypothetical protein